MTPPQARPVLSQSAPHAVTRSSRCRPRTPNLDHTQLHARARVRTRCGASMLERRPLPRGARSAHRRPRFLRPLCCLALVRVDTTQGCTPSHHSDPSLTRTGCIPMLIGALPDLHVCYARLDGHGVGRLCCAPLGYRGWCLGFIPRPHTERRPFCPPVLFNHADSYWNACRQCTRKSFPFSEALRSVRPAAPPPTRGAP